MLPIIIHILRNISEETKYFMIKHYYMHHHKILSDMVQKVLNEHGKCLIIDLHSFSYDVLPNLKEKPSKQVDICIGTDNFHTPKNIISKLEEILNDNGLTYQIDYPFAGTIVPLNFYMKKENVSSIMIEINRSLYQGETNFKTYVKIIKHIISTYVNNAV